MKLLNRELLQANIEKIAEYDFKNQKIFGCSYAVLQEDQVVFQKHFGFMFPQGEIPVSDDTVFRLASMTKPITAVAALILIDRGQLALSDHVCKYLPEFENIHIIQADEKGMQDFGRPKRQPTVCNLLTHTSGIGSNLIKLKKMSAEDKSTIDKTIAFLVRSGLDFEPFTHQQYSATGAFDVLVKIIENCTKTDYETFLKKEVFEPCGMKNTTFMPTGKQWDKMIGMHNKIDGRSITASRKEGCVFEDYPSTHFLGGAGLVSTLADYLKFSKMLLDGGQTSERRLLSDEAFRLLHTPFVPKDIMPLPESWGLGVRVVVDRSYGDLPVGAFGWSGAYGTHFWVDPENRIAAVYMKNSLIDGGSGNESARNFEKAVNSSFK